MHHGITVLNFDQTYTVQSFLQDESCNWVDLDTIPGTNLYCPQETLRQLAQKLRSLPGKNITFIGSGNYHYVSFLLLSKIQQPFTLILFDYHIDMLPSPSESIISCGSWVLDSLRKIPVLQKVIIIGVQKDWLEQIPVSLREKVSLFEESLLHRDYRSTVYRVVNEIPTDAVYISVDKDVLDADEAATLWDQGSMKLHQLVEIVDEIAWRKEICGFDVCGEYPFSPTDRFRRHVREAVAKNERANQVILEHVKAAELL